MNSSSMFSSLAFIRWESSPSKIVWFSYFYFSSSINLLFLGFLSRAEAGFDYFFLEGTVELGFADLIGFFYYPF